MSTQNWRPMLLTLSALALAAGTARGQSSGSPEWMRPLIKNAEDPKLQPQKDLRKKQMGLEKELKKLRFTYFRSEHRPTRLEGLSKLAGYGEGWMVQPLLEVFQDETSEDIRSAVIGVLRAEKGDESDRALMWLAVSNKSDDWRTAALAALNSRLIELKDKPTDGMLAVLQGAVTSQDQGLADNGAKAGNVLRMYEIIPFLIQAQTPPPPASAGPIGRPRNGPLAWIAIAQQQAYIADMNPIVADNAVAWQPVPGVVTSGVVLVINDAVATFNPIVIHQSLVDLSSRLGGRSTDSLGMKFSPWQNWYKDGGERAIAKAAEKRAEDRAQEAAASDKTAAAAAKDIAKPAEPASEKAGAPKAEPAK